MIAVLHTPEAKRVWKRNPTWAKCLVNLLGCKTKCPLWAIHSIYSTYSRGHGLLNLFNPTQLTRLLRAFCSGAWGESLVRKLIMVSLYIQCETAGGETAPWIWLHYNTCVRTVLQRARNITTCTTNTCLRAVLQRARVHGSWDWVIPSGLASSHPGYCTNILCNFCFTLYCIQNIWVFNYLTKANKLRRYICSVLKWID